VGLRISEIRFYGQSRGEFITYVSIGLNGKFVIKWMKIIRRKGSRELMITMPCHKRYDGSHIDIAHPITPEARKELEEQIFAAWDRHCGKTADR